MRKLSVNTNQLVTISEDVLAQEVSGEIVLLDLKGEQYLGLNEVGARVWQLLQNNSDLRIIFDTLLEEYEVDSKLLENDLNELITSMYEVGIVDVKEKGA